MISKLRLKEDRRFFILAICLFFTLRDSYAQTDSKDLSEKSLELRYGKTSLINPLLDCAELNHSSLGQMIRLEKKIKLEIEKQIEMKNSSKISVYFRELNNGHWIGVGENEKYSPASLLKLPILLAAYKQAELDPLFLTKKVNSESHRAGYIQNLGNNGFVLPVDRIYSIQELLEIMIVFSDNTAKDLVVKNLDPKILNNSFDDLGIDIFRYKDFEYSISTKEYATYFRVLYNASYLNKEYSKKALELLLKSRFKLGLVSQLPLDVAVAHKFGERDIDEVHKKQLHDCGIVYLENKPYIVCIMVIGNEFKSIENTIGSISKLIFDFLNGQRVLD